MLKSETLDTIWSSVSAWRSGPQDMKSQAAALQRFLLNNLCVDEPVSVPAYANRSNFLISACLTLLHLRRERMVNTPHSGVPR